jgi:Tetratrico peptide repeat
MTWGERLADLWTAIDELEPDDFRARMAALAAERPPGHAVALGALARHLPRYNRSLANYANDLSQPGT